MEAGRALTQITACEVCGNAQLNTVLDLGPNPLCDDLVAVDDTRICREYPIEILLCENCLTAHQRFQVPKQELFPASYHYRSRFTADVLNGMAGLVASCERQFGALAGKKVLDIGCNDGSLLDFFRQKGAITLGLEPTDAYREAEQKGHVTFNKFLGPDIASAIVASHGQPDFITFTNVFAHIENLQGVLDSLKRLMAARTVIVIENHYLGSVLDRNQFDTFYHEHARTYSYASFAHVARSLDAAILRVEFPARYGGNIRVFLGARIGSVDGNAIDLRELDRQERQFPAQFAAMRGNIDRWRFAKSTLIREQVRQYGRLRAKAFPGRAAILVRLLGLTAEHISAVYEKPGSLKIGYYVPGTRIPILSDDELFAMPDKTLPLLNFAWHIPDEIHDYVRGHGYTGPILDILDAEDFAKEQ